MSRIFVHGVGAVSPAGWGVAPLRAALAGQEVCPPHEPERRFPNRQESQGRRSEPIWKSALQGSGVQSSILDSGNSLSELARPGWSKPFQVRRVPTPETRPAFLSHPRLRRASPIAHFAVAAALEALGADAARVREGAWRLGVVLCSLTGCVNYSRRFYDETLRDPATASPLVFPETVFNAPASHLAALLGTTAINYTLVGDPGVFLQGLAVAANWLGADQVDGCLVIGAEEMDWLTADAFRPFTRRVVPAEGAGALYLRREPDGSAAVELAEITDPHLFFDQDSRRRAAAAMRAQLPGGVAAAWLCDGRQDCARLDAPEMRAWQDWPGTRLSPKRILGEGLMAAAAWQCVAAVDALAREQCATATVSVVGCNEMAIGARLARA